MDNVLHNGEVDRRPYLAPEHPRTLEREGRNPPALGRTKDHTYCELNRALLPAGAVSQHPRRLRNREEPAEATP